MMKLLHREVSGGHLSRDLISVYLSDDTVLQRRYTQGKPYLLIFSWSCLIVFLTLSVSFSAKKRIPDRSNVVWFLQPFTTTALLTLQPQLVKMLVLWYHSWVSPVSKTPDVIGWGDPSLWLPSLSHTLLMCLLDYDVSTVLALDDWHRYWYTVCELQLTANI